MKKKIKLTKSPTGWVAQFVGDKKTIDLFGTDTIPTCFTKLASAAEVLTAIKKLNPECNITVNNQPN